MTRPDRRSINSPPPAKHPYTQAALDKPKILRRNKNGVFMTSQQIWDDDACMLAEKKARPSSRPPVNKPEEVFPASGWPTGPQAQQNGDDESPTCGNPLAVPESPPPIPAKSPLRPRVVYNAALTVQQSSPSSSFYGSPGWGSQYRTPWSSSGALPPCVGQFASPSLPPSVPSEYLGEPLDVAPIPPFQGPRGVDYNPDTTGLKSEWSSSSSSSEGSVVADASTSSGSMAAAAVTAVALRGRRKTL